MHRNTRLAVAIAALTLAASTTFANEPMDDAAITGKVKAALMADPTAKAHQIDVETKGGVVQLNGFVDSSENKVAAARVAGGVEGVKGVDNNLDVQTADRDMGTTVDDATITGKVKAALIADSATKATEINVDTREGTVQLNGFVGTQTAKDRAAELAKGIEGVRSVENNLAVKL
jgi:hyperosmotically inducible protein